MATVAHAPVDIHPAPEYLLGADVRWFEATKNEATGQYEAYVMLETVGVPQPHGVCVTLETNDPDFGFLPFCQPLNKAVLVTAMEKGNVYYHVQDDCTDQTVHNMTFYSFDPAVLEKLLANPAGTIFQQ